MCGPYLDLESNYMLKNKKKKKRHLTTRNVNAEWTFDDIKKMISS